MTKTKTKKKRLTARQQMKRKGLLNLFTSIPCLDRDDDGMTSVIPSSTPRANIRISSQNIHKLSFPFVSPLCPEHDRGRALGRHRRLWEKFDNFPKGFGLL
jgi:hypothetical protein